MAIITQTKRREYLLKARKANKEGYPIKAEDVIQQLFEPANYAMKLARAIWNVRQPYTAPLNVIRDTFVKEAKDVLERRVDNPAAILHLDKREAASLFRGFLDSVAVVDWSNQEQFENLNKTYKTIISSVLYLGTNPERKMDDIKTNKGE